jgi:rare lipoprotein A
LTGEIRIRWLGWLVLVAGVLAISVFSNAAEARQCGAASWYGDKFAGKRTASGVRFNPNDMVAAHRTLPFGSRVRVTEQRSGRSVTVKIVDRGPHVRGRVIDVSKAAARKLGFLRRGTARVCITR